MKRLLVLGLILASSFASTASRADSTRTAWWIETRPWTCAKWTAPLAQEIQLACDAARSCTVADTEAHADRRAVLTCAPEGAPEAEHGSIDGQSATGVRLWSVTLSGPPAEALRQASMWVARAESGAPIDPTPSPRSAPDGTTSNATHDTGAPPAHDTRNGKIAFDLQARGGYFFNPDHDANLGPTIALRAALVRLMGAGAHVGLALTGELSPGTAHLTVPDGTSVDGTGRLYLARAGVAMGWGAPHTRDPFGAALEVGGGYGSVPDAVFVGMAPGGSRYLPRQMPVGLAYFSARALLQPFGASTPYLAVDLGANRSGLPNDLGSLFLGAGVGYAWGGN